jgi:cysteine desulfurase
MSTPAKPKPSPGGRGRAGPPSDKPPVKTPKKSPKSNSKGKSKGKSPAKKKPPAKKSPAKKKAPTKKKTSPCRGFIFLDNNGTTLISDQALKVHTKWMKCYNASTDSRLALHAKQTVNRASDAVLSHCGVSSATHTAVFTSGGTESNCLVIRACVKAYRQKLAEQGVAILPHVITSATEHPSIMGCLEDLHGRAEIEVSYVRPTIYGNILPEDVEASIRPNTCLISIMYANNEVPVINNIRAIAAVAKRAKIPIHSDCVQVFGKYRINVKTDGITALSASAHKFNGPKGNGLLVISNELIEGYGLTAEISGNQQGGLRGGTLDVAGIASTAFSIKHAFVKRQDKTKRLYKLRTHLLKVLRAQYKFADYETYLEDSKVPDSKRGALELVSLGPSDADARFILPNTVLLAVCKNQGRPFCNIDLKKYLDRQRIIISVGSACSTDKETASHVLDAIGAPSVIKRGVVRVSFGDQTTQKEVDVFVRAFRDGLMAQCKDIKLD